MQGQNPDEPLRVWIVQPTYDRSASRMEFDIGDALERLHEMGCNVLDVKYSYSGRSGHGAMIIYKNTGDRKEN